MKKILVILSIIVSIFATSCDDNHNSKSSVSQTEYIINMDNENIARIHYNGHKYIVFPGETGAVDDPDCEACKIRMKTIITEVIDSIYGKE